MNGVTDEENQAVIKKIIEEEKRRLTARQRETIRSLLKDRSGPSTRRVG